MVNVKITDSFCRWSWSLNTGMYTVAHLRCENVAADNGAQAVQTVHSTSACEKEQQNRAAHHKDNISYMSPRKRQARLPRRKRALIMISETDHNAHWWSCQFCISSTPSTSKVELQAGQLTNGSPLFPRRTMARKLCANCT